VIKKQVFNSFVIKKNKFFYILATLWPFKRP